MNTSEAYLVYCSTGCTCCWEENHYRGPYKSKEDAEARVQWLYDHTYAKKGRYQVQDWGDAEILDDGRVIVCTRVYDDFVTVNPDGSVNFDDRCEEP